ncbi:MAG: arginine repressor [Bacteroidales bacterium]|nr:arginine repressor [Bacteroidales bacterium]
MSPKTNRLNFIREMIAQHQLSSQEELLGMMEQAGFEVTQATLSRDLKLMKVVKAPNEKGIYVYTLPQSIKRDEQTTASSRDSRTLSGFISVEFSNQLAVVKTRPGHASAIAYEIDTNASHVILGTIAGDDTILLIPREGFTRQEIENALSELF